MVANVQRSAMHTYLLSYYVMFVSAFAFPKWSIIKCNPVWWRLMWDNQYTGSGLKLPKGLSWWLVSGACHCRKKHEAYPSLLLNTHTLTLKT